MMIVKLYDFPRKISEDLKATALSSTLCFPLNPAFPPLLFLRPYDTLLYLRWGKRKPTVLQRLLFLLVFAGSSSNCFYLLLGTLGSLHHLSVALPVPCI